MQISRFACFKSFGKSIMAIKFLLAFPVNVIVMSGIISDSD